MISPSVSMKIFGRNDEQSVGTKNFYHGDLLKIRLDSYTARDLPQKNRRGQKTRGQRIKRRMKIFVHNGLWISMAQKFLMEKNNLKFEN